MAFFGKAIDPKLNTPENKKRLLRQEDTKRADMTLDDTDNYIEMHSDSMSRILFIYAKLNPGIKYT